MILAAQLFLICWYITEQEYIVKFIRETQFKYKDKPYLYQGFEILQCLKCFSFWTILLITFNIWYALLFSFIGAYYKR